MYCFLVRLLNAPPGATAALLALDRDVFDSMLTARDGVSYVQERVVRHGGVLWDHAGAERLLSEHELQSDGRRVWVRVKYSSRAFSCVNCVGGEPMPGYFVRLVSEVNNFWFLLEARERKEALCSEWVPIGAHETQAYEIPT